MDWLNSYWSKKYLLSRTILWGALTLPIGISVFSGEALENQGCLTLIKSLATGDYGQDPSAASLQEIAFAHHVRYGSDQALDELVNEIGNIFSEIKKSSNQKISIEKRLSVVAKIKAGSIINGDQIIEALESAIPSKQGRAVMATAYYLWLVKNTSTIEAYGARGILQDLLTRLSQQDPQKSHELSIKIYKTLELSRMFIAPNWTREQQRKLESKVEAFSAILLKTQKTYRIVDLETFTSEIEEIFDSESIFLLPESVLIPSHPLTLAKALEIQSDLSAGGLQNPYLKILLMIHVATSHEKRLEQLKKIVRLHLDQFFKESMAFKWSVDRIEAKHTYLLHLQKYYQNKLNNSISP